MQPRLINMYLMNTKVVEEMRSICESIIYFFIFVFVLVIVQSMILALAQAGLTVLVELRSKVTNQIYAFLNGIKSKWSIRL